MANNQYINKVIYGNATLLDLTSDTATADKVLKGYTFHDKTGTPVIGTADGGATITITYTEDFYNQTITCSHGTKSYSKVATSSGSVEFNVDEEGTWVISCVIDGQPYTTTVDIDLSGEGNLTRGINGKTVTPTDDIDTWIKCAGLQNTNNYSTLAEVLADTELFDTLLRDSNACDYMSRSTTWALNTGDVPVMTDATHPSGEVSVTTTLTTGTEGYRAFDGNTQTGWLAYGSTNERVSYRFTTPQVINKVSFSNFAYDGNTRLRIKNFKVEGRNGSNAWQTLYTGVFSGSTTGDIQTYSFENDTPYEEYSILIIDTASSDTKAGINNIQFYSADITTNADAMARVGMYDYCSESLLDNETWCEAIAESEYAEEVFDITVPKMTDGTHPSGEVIGSSTYQSYYQYYVFDKSTSTKWHSTQGMPQYIGYHFPQASKILYVKLRTHADAGGPKVSKVQGSNDGTNWTDLGNFVDCATPGTWYGAVIDNSASYNYYRLLITESNYGDYAMIGELQFYGRHDSAVYQPLIPIMTDATHPSGEAVEDSHISNAEAWKMFDGDSNTAWLSNVYYSSSGAYYGGYIFPESKHISKITLTASKSSYVQSNACKLQYKSGESWLDVTNGSFAVTGDGQNFSFDVDLTTDGIRIYGQSSRQYGNASFNTMQCYDTVPLTNRIHSCPQDTLYIMEDGSPVILATTDDNGIGEIDWENLNAGVYTIYSTVAKDPNNLSNAYSKSIRVTKSEYGHTVDARIIPDIKQLLYWFGLEGKNLEDATNANGWFYESGHNLIASAHNVNSIISTNTSAGYAGIGNKNALTSGTTIHCIANIDTDYVRRFLGTNKQLTTGQQNVTKQGLAVYDFTRSSNTYFALFCYSGSFTTYAMWIE